MANKIEGLFKLMAPTIKILNIRTYVQGFANSADQIRMLLKEQSDQDLHCLPFNLHCLDALKIQTAQFLGKYGNYLTNG